MALEPADRDQLDEDVWVMELAALETMAEVSRREK